MFPRYLWGADWQKYRTPVLRSMVIIGYMQSGKTTFARYLAYLMHRELTAKGVDDSHIAYVEAPNLKLANTEIPTILDTERTRYLMLFVDDAIKSAHSRRHNVEETQLFSDVRHWTLPRGILITMYATQDFRLLDRLMRNAMVYAWKTLPFEWWVSTDKSSRQQILAWIGDPDIVDLLEAITQAIYSNDPSRSLAALQTAVVRIPVQKWGPRPIKGIQPYTPPEEIWYRIDPYEYENEKCNDIDTDVLLHGLTRLLRVLLYEGWRVYRNKDKYLMLRTPSSKQYTIGPLYEIPEIKKIVDEAVTKQ